MKYIFYIFFVAVCCSLNFSCTGEELYREQTKRIDSLYGAVSTAGAELSADSAELFELVDQYWLYGEYIETHPPDTLSRLQAESLQSFDVAGKNMANFISNKKLFLYRLALHLEQLSKLRDDAMAAAIDPEGLSAIINEERLHAHSFTGLVRHEMNELHDAMQEFRVVVPLIQELIRAQNQGQLPEDLQKNTGVDRWR